MACRSFLAPPFRTGINSPLPAPIFRWISSRIVSCNGRVCPHFICSHSPVIAETIEMTEYRDKFAKRMAMAGLKPHHRIAIAVSGGPDSIALCVLTACWKTDDYNAATNDRSQSIDGLLAIVVDHRLRKESTEEANLVRDRIIDMGIKCEVSYCEWLNGKPQPGHVQEAARNKRYEILQNICVQQQIGVLLVAHHSDDQAELFILRLSRNSGVLGLAGMALSSQMFPNFPDFNGEGSKTHGMLLVRPLLDFSKEDMYNICRGGNQPWVEDPTNRSQLYARNRIRASLKLSSTTFKTELQAVISACRKTRLHVNKHCRVLLNQAVTIIPDGYAVIDLVVLHSLEAKDIVLAKFIALVLQFISQRHRPVRGNAQKLLLNYLRTFPCKSSFTVASCYLCPAPGSNGTKLLACCSIHPSLPLNMELFPVHSHEGHNRLLTTELPQIITDSEAHLNKLILNPSDIPFLDVKSSESVLSEAKGLGVLSDSTHKCILSFQQKESEIFTSKAEIVSDFESSNSEKLSGATNKSKLIYPGQMGYFMDRFILNWKPSNVVSYSISSETEEKCLCCSCVIGDEKVAEVRHMFDADWLYLADLSRKKNEEDSQLQNYPGEKTKQVEGKRMSCLDHAVLSANKALVRLKSIPVAARRSLPVIVNAKGILLSIPSVGFSHCPHVLIYAVFNPRIPLGGGHSSFL